MNVQKFYETLAAIISEREGVKITVTVRRKDEATENEDEIESRKTKKGAA